MNNRNQFSFLKTLFTITILISLFLGYAIYYNVKEKLKTELKNEVPLKKSGKQTPSPVIKPKKE